MVTESTSSEQLKTTHCLARALAKSFTLSVLPVPAGAPSRSSCRAPIKHRKQRSCNHGDITCIQIMPRGPMKCLRTITVHEFESAVEGTRTCIACHCYTCVHACTSVFCPHALSTVHVVKMYGCVQWMCVCACLTVRGVMTSLGEAPRYS